MANTILIKRSNVANSVPASGNLQAGELAINYTDGNLFFKDNNGNVQTIASQKFVSVSGNVTAGNIQTAGLVSATGNVTAGNVVTVGQVSATGNVSGNYFIGNGSQLTGILSNAFSTISVASQSNVISNSTGVVNFVSGSGMTITTDPTTGSVTFVSTSVGSIFQTGGTMGLVTEAVTSAEDLGLITDIWTVGYDLGTLVVEGLIWPEQLKLPSYTVAGLPSPGIIGLMAFATNAAGGSIPVFSDGSNWRRVDDRSIVT